MYEKLKKASLKGAIGVSVVLFIVGGLLIGFFGKGAVYAIKGYDYLDDIMPTDLKDQYVELDLNVCFGGYLKSSEKNTDTGKVTVKSYNYVIQAFDYTEAGDEYEYQDRYMSIKIPPKMMDQLDAITDQTYAYMYGETDTLAEPLHLHGRIRKLPNDEYSYFVKFFTEEGLTTAEVEEETIPYYIDISSSSIGFDKGYHLLFAGAGLACVIFGIFRLVSASGGGYLKKFRKDCEQAGYSESVIESDYASAAGFGKKDAVKVGNLCTYFSSGATPRAIPNKNISWAYMHTVTHRTYGIKTGTTYSIMVYAEGQKNPYNISTGNEATTLQILEKYAASFPWIIVGYDKDLEKMFKKDHAQFLNLKYNQVEHTPVYPSMEGFDNPQ